MAALAKYRCPNKACPEYRRAYVVPKDPDEGTAVDQGRLYVGRRVDATYRNGQRVAAYVDLSRARVIRCREGHNVERYLVEVGSSRTECGARCINAVGPACDCRCRGANHGAH